MAKEPFPSDKQDKFMLRLPTGMRERIKAAADDNNRSMNSEIVAVLEEKYPEPVSRDEQAEAFLLNWVISSKDDNEMRDRAMHANKMLSDSGKNLEIRVLDDIGAKVMKAPAVLVYQHRVGSEPRD
mgnify:CR=1 FL=1